MNDGDVQGDNGSELLVGLWTSTDLAHWAEMTIYRIAFKTIFLSMEAEEIKNAEGNMKISWSHSMTSLSQTTQIQLTHAIWQLIKAFVALIMSSYTRIL